MDHPDAVGPSGRERLLHDHGNAMPSRQVDQLAMTGHRGYDVDEVQFLALEHLGSIRIDARHLELSAGPTRLVEIPIADGLQLHTIDFPPRVQVVLREETATDDGTSQLG